MGEMLMEDVVAALRRKDSSLAAQVLSEFLEEGNQGELLVALREMTDAFGDAQNLAEQVGLQPRQFDCQLSSDGDPSVSDFSAILKAMGMQLRVRNLR
ncbi:addiction module antidote protein [Dechloromonas denitrificans]|uniref:helix-turn-helix domain-containing transcriptional regulator n=1 Tax=Dechloromonas denitrificans TaxID=281362 RepID=UPI001CF87F5D|nr:addiction module antidote protein [Dechloromonas denitrificans]UCV11320.1 addiction module antidote protein [Dechloromonas denitrificans]